jgi:hypothetical protein
MKQVTINLYSFGELSKENQDKAISNLSDINTSFDWWENTYEDAENIGLKLTGFDFDSASFVRDLQGEFINDAELTANAIIKEHGKDCETYKTAKVFLSDLKKQAKLITNGTDGDTDSIADLESVFLGDLLIDYKNMLQEEYEYQSSEEAIKETIEANDYIFFEDGKLTSCTTYTGKHPKSGTTELKFHGRIYDITK